ncbi:MAG: peptide chain release factor N(5)-glutamine methyltransferase [Clostridiales bacterium]|nr:peptide chain release factor N(5)-glutamine methyltransferase [Clostridiales bacterium]
MSRKTIREAIKGSAALIGGEDARFDAECLLTSVLKKDMAYIAASSETELSEKEEKELFELTKRRAEGEPLQYILGEWEFMGLPFKVGKGVLIPRQETELAAELTIDAVKKRGGVGVVIDVCSGSGCIGISTAYYEKNASVYAVEKYDEAYAYLLKNKELNGVKNVTPVKLDMFDGPLKAGLPRPDIIVSNPPYIPEGELPLLQRELFYEPRSAQVGGADGLIFYRALYSLWLPYLKDGGVMIAEIGEDQAEKIKEIFKDKDVKVYKDIYGNDRAFTVTKGE